MNRTLHGADRNGGGPAGSDAWVIALAVVTVLVAVVTVVLVLLRHPMLLGFLVALVGAAAGWW